MPPVADSDPSFFARLALAFVAFFRVLFNAAYAGRVWRLGQRRSHAPVSAPAPERAPAAPPAPEAPKLRAAPTDAALQLLGLLQREGRLIDFLQEDMAGYADADIGAAARVVHDQCRKALTEHVKLERIRAEAEGAASRCPRASRRSEVRLDRQRRGRAAVQRHAHARRLARGRASSCRSWPRATTCA